MKDQASFHQAVPAALDAGVPETKTMAVLGSTGSIGSQALSVADQEGYRVAALAAGRNMEVLAGQIARFAPSFVSVADEAARHQLLARLDAMGVRQPAEIGLGRQGAVRAAGWPEADTVLAAITGFAGLEPVLAAASAGKKIALANKESLVAAGEEVKRRAAMSGAWLLPVDSEHSAVWQCMLAAPGGSVRRVILTCSGGPFHGRSSEELRLATAAEALSHPTWTMGGKITIDSATLMNKAFEVIEACHLFDLDHRAIDVVIHRQSIVHSMVEFSDGALMAQLGPPDMTIPIRFALTFPDRSARAGQPTFDLLAPGHRAWTFEAVDEDLFPSLAMARQAFDSGGLMPLVLNAANEAALALFLEGAVAFTGIFDLVRRALDDFSHLSAIKASSFDAMMSAHCRVTEHVRAAGLV